MIPVLLVLIGLSFIFKDTINRKVKSEIKNIEQNKDNEYCAMFGEQNINFSNEEFKGCNLTAVFGEIECDMRDAIIKKDSVINISAIFGNVKIIVPDNVKIKVTGTPIFGGVTNKRKNNKDSDKTIYINATCLFGGVDIK